MPEAVLFVEAARDAIRLVQCYRLAASYRTMMPHCVELRRRSRCREANAMQKQYAARHSRDGTGR